MKYYNLYYGMSRINKSPIEEYEVEKIARIGKPIKKFQGDKMIEIPLNKIRVVKCTIV